MIRFRTQDTRKCWAKKLNQLFKPLNLPAAKYPFREVPGTWLQWERELDRIKRALAPTYALTHVGRFDVGDTRQMWTRNLNRLSAAISAGPTGG